MLCASVLAELEKATPVEERPRPTSEDVVSVSSLTFALAAVAVATRPLPTALTVLHALAWCVVALPLGAFGSFHALLALFNYTTIEFLEKRGLSAPPGHVNRYDLGPWRNLQAALGGCPLTWPLPVRWGCVGDGLSFPLNPALAAAGRPDPSLRSLV